MIVSQQKKEKNPPKNYGKNLDNPYYLDSPNSLHTPPPPPQSEAGGGEDVSYYDFEADGFGITRQFLTGWEKNKPLAPGCDYLRVSGQFNSLHHLQVSLALLFDSEDFTFQEVGWSAGAGATKFTHRLVFDGLVVGGYRVIELNPADSAKVLSDYQGMTDFQRSLVASYYDDLGVDDIPDTYVECCLQFSGSFFALLTLHQQYQYLRKLWYFGFCRCSRIDLRCDDYSFEIIPTAEMVRATLAGDVFGFQNYTPVRNFNINTGELSGYGDYWGSRESAKYIRNYVHKFDDGTSCIRFEGEFKRNFAQSIYDLLVHFYDGADLPQWDDLLEGNYYYTDIDKQDYLDSELSEKSLDDFGNLVCHVLFGVIDFRNKSQAKNPAKASVRDTERLPFWQQFLEIIGGRVKVKREPVKASTLPSAMRWLWRQCGNTLTVLIEGLGFNEFSRMMSLIHEYSLKKLHFSHLEMIELIRKFPNIVNDLGGDMFEF